MMVFRITKNIFYVKYIAKKTYLFPIRPHRSLGRLRDELQQQDGLRISGVQCISSGRGRCRRSVKKRITFLGRRRCAFETAARESRHSLCTARSQDVSAYQVSVYDALFSPTNKESVKSITVGRRASRLKVLQAAPRFPNSNPTFYLSLSFSLFCLSNVAHKNLVNFNFRNWTTTWRRYSSSYFST